MKKTISVCIRLNCCIWFDLMIFSEQHEASWHELSLQAPIVPYDSALIRSNNFLHTFSISWYFGGNLTFTFRISIPSDWWDKSVILSSAFHLRINQSIGVSPSSFRTLIAIGWTSSRNYHQQDRTAYCTVQWCFGIAVTYWCRFINGHYDNGDIPLHIAVEDELDKKVQILLKLVPKSA